MRVRRSLQIAAAGVALAASAVGVTGVAVAAPKTSGLGIIAGPPRWTLDNQVTSGNCWTGTTIATATAYYDVNELTIGDVPDEVGQVTLEWGTQNDPNPPSLVFQVNGTQQTVDVNGIPTINDNGKIFTSARDNFLYLQGSGTQVDNQIYYGSFENYTGTLTQACVQLASDKVLSGLPPVIY